MIENRNLISISLLLTTVLLIVLSSVNKAVHLDDVTFVNLAREQPREPFPMGLRDFNINFKHYPVFVDTHPPLFASYLALWVWVKGYVHEPLLHLATIIFPAIAAVSMFYLGKRFTGSSLIPALLMIVSPGFMVMSASLMSDVPALALSFATVTTYIYAIDKEDRKLLLISLVFLLLAIATAYQNLSLLLLLPLYAFLVRKRRVICYLPALLGGIGFILLIGFWYFRTGLPPKFSYSMGFILDPGFLVQKVRSTVSVIGGAVIFPAMLAIGLLRDRKDCFIFLLILLAASAMIVFQIANGSISVAAGILATLFFSCGILAVYKFADLGLLSAKSWFVGKKNADDLFLCLWLTGVLFYCLVLLPYASTRYLLQATPPLILLFMRLLAANPIFKKNWRKLAWISIFLTFLTGASLSIADYKLSSVYRDFAQNIDDQVVKETVNVWFSGEFGLRYYLEAQGARYLVDDDNSPAGGDIIITSSRVIANSLSDTLKQRITLEKQVEFQSAWPVRIQDPGSQAGFYDQFHGPLPFSISSEPVEAINIYRVKK